MDWQAWHILASIKYASSDGTFVTHACIVFCPYSQTHKAPMRPRMQMHTRQLQASLLQGLAQQAAHAAPEQLAATLAPLVDSAYLLPEAVATELLPHVQVFRCAAPVALKRSCRPNPHQPYIREQLLPPLTCSHVCLRRPHGCAVKWPLPKHPMLSTHLLTLTVASPAPLTRNTLASHPMLVPFAGTWSRRCQPSPHACAICRDMVPQVSALELQAAKEDEAANVLSQGAEFDELMQSGALPHMQLSPQVQISSAVSAQRIIQRGAEDAMR
eukprot:364795-Chlamydomonas_euryale.AAC.25